MYLITDKRYFIAVFFFTRPGCCHSMGGDLSTSHCHRASVLPDHFCSVWWSLQMV